MKSKPRANALQELRELAVRQGYVTYDQVDEKIDHSLDSEAMVSQNGRGLPSSPGAERPLVRE